MGSTVPVTVPPASGAPPACTYGILGCSPRTRDCTPVNTATAARKFFKRLQYDASLEATQFSVGLLETREQAERRSGAEAWSLRLTSSLTELGFGDFVARYEKHGEEIPFHRIVWFKQNGVVVWEAESLKAKLLGAGGDSSNSHSSHSNHTHHHQLNMPAVVPLGSSFIGCSPPAASFMCRLAAGASPAAAGSSLSSSTPAGLPPRASSSSQECSASSSSRPQRLSGTDYTGSPSSWGGPGHWSATAAASGGLSGAAAGTGHGSYHGHSSAGLSPLLGTSPIGCALSAGHSSSSYPYGTSPKTFSGSWTAGASSFTAGGSMSGGGILGSSCQGLASVSPAGSCSSSWTGTSPLAAAVAAGTPLPGTRPSTAGTSASAATAAGLWTVGAVELLGCQAVGEGVQEQLAERAAEEEELALVDYSMLPEECWLDVLQRLGVKELCYMSRVSRSLRGLAARCFLWSSAYGRLFGMPPPADWSSHTVKRLCRRSELRASRWVEAEIEGRQCGFSGSWCCQLDDAKVLSGDGCCVRLWSHDTGRRIATLRGHTGRVTAVAFDEELIISGCSQGTVKLWSMDELKLSKTLRHHTDTVSAAALLPSGLPISGSKDGTVCIWDPAAPNSPLVVLQHGAPVHAMQLQEDRGQLITSSNSLGVWDLNTTQLLFSLQAPAGLARLSSSGASTSSLSTAAAAAAAGLAAGSTAAGAAAAAAQAGVDRAGDGLDGADADAADGVLLHAGWLLDEDSSSDEEGDGPGVAGAAGVIGGTLGGDGKPFTCVSCHGNLVAAGRAGSVVLWDIRSQDPVGAITPAALGSFNLRPSNSPCVGVQLDDWKLLTGWAGSGSGSGGGSSSCWWRSSSDIAATEPPASHSLELYDIRATSSFSSCDAGAAGACSSTAASKGLWSAEPVMSLPVPNRVTCFQFYGQMLLIGQEGAECCLMSFNPPGSSTVRAAAAWGYGGAGGNFGNGSAGTLCYGVSPGNGMYGFEDPGSTSEGGGGGGGGGRGGKGSKKKGAAKVPAKKQTRYPKRTTR